MVSPPLSHGASKPAATPAFEGLTCGRPAPNANPDRSKQGPPPSLEQARRLRRQPSFAFNATSSCGVLAGVVAGATAGDWRLLHTFFFFSTFFCATLSQSPSKFFFRDWVNLFVI